MHVYMRVCASPALLSQGAIDNPRLDIGEFAVFIVDFGRNNVGPYNRSEMVAIGVPQGFQAGALSSRMLSPLL